MTYTDTKNYLLLFFVVIIMAKKKTEETTFNIEQALTELACPEMWKAGLKYYIETNCTIKNKKDFDKAVKDYAKLK